jgi:hypothetical protein
LQFPSMSQTITGRTSIFLDRFVLAVCSVLLICFLVYIDEGHYNFDWATNIRTWLGIFAVSGFIFAGQIFVYHRLLQNFRWVGKTAVTFVLGTVGSLGGFSLCLYIVVQMYKLVADNSV